MKKLKLLRRGGLLVGVVALAFIFTSCLTAERIRRNCYKFAQICVTGTETEVTYRDTTIYFKPIAARLPESNISIQTELKVTEGKINLPRQITKHGLITTEVEIIDNRLFVKSYLNDSSILVQPDPVIIRDAIREEKTKQSITLPPERYIPKAYRIAFWIVIAQIFFLVFLIISYSGVCSRVWNFFRKTDNK